MSQWKCVACGGLYSDTQPDGSIYFHACAPLPADANGNALERPNKRDENITIDRRGFASGVVAAGAGVAPVGANVLPQPKWLSDMLAAAAKRSQ